MKKHIINFVCELHGYLIRTKEIHWNTPKNSIHKLCDEIEEDIMSCEDRFMECAMGLSGKKIEIGQLLPLLPESTSLEDMLSELSSDTLKMKKSLDEISEGGLINVIDDLLEVVGKYKYRATQL